ncbi:carotenoid cleavage dioxygenase 7 [Genlisea aurea]|uniref:Carotenoid cleavage dioxygenase 7 n=1 Tax=Genlisea aurea TaxID=192259 RepID=S8DF74_9LAMI|nr:carotenoid cleavage dioxygenase 7 [Genlisea aurea]
MMNLERGKEKLLPHLVQVTIDLEGGFNACRCVVNDDQWTKPADFPIINPDFSGVKSRFIYAATSSGSRPALPHFPFDTVVKLDAADDSASCWSTVPRRYIGEPIFIPRRNGGREEGEEDDGYILAVEYAVSTQRCYLVILDSRSIGKEEAVVARLQVPRHLNFPMGFHGFWAPTNHTL